MKILHVNVVYAVGSTGKIVYDIHKSLIDKGYESIVLYGREKKVKERNVYKTSTQMAVVYNALKSRVIGIPYAGSFFSTNRIIGIIKREKPDIVHLHCINGHFVNIKRLMCFLKENNIK
jgi:putative colanic acid biosynthesis glycosyltransferase